MKVRRLGTIRLAPAYAYIVEVPVLYDGQAYLFQLLPDATVTLRNMCPYELTLDSSARIRLRPTSHRIS